MTKKFSNPRFRKNRPFKTRPQFNSFNKDKVPKICDNGSYKNGFVDRSKTRYFKCNKIVHFLTDYKNLKKEKQ